ncbi:sulfatase [Parapedobacter koreensis]|uniref:Iduronate 2-sulfatase n=1 Tax=Parapedobacter koreensis TaxID=332977 RepID=A0A1H7RKT2_9SPHI|nr:sulfatase [Parapedobacter koreensis]SEL60890.1 iduronate 2-sulfatase [Parapedobacter koreensis]
MTRRNHKPRHRQTKWTTVYVLVGLWVGISCTTAHKPDKPNVLLILVDDLRPAIGAYGDSIAITPNMDKLAAKGLLFKRAYSNQAVCGPSRYNLLLGSRSTSSGIYNFGSDFRDHYPDAVTLPQYFKQHGYHAESMGKVFHVGHNTYDDTASWSVPHYKDRVIEYVDSASKKEGFTREEALFSNMEWGYARSLPRGLAWESPDVADDAYADGRISNRAIERLRNLKSNPDRPFFLAVGFARPHLPFSVPKKYWDMYDESALPLPQHTRRPEGAPSYAVKYGDEIDQYIPIPTTVTEAPFPDSLSRKLIHGYYAGVSYVDVQIGKVLNELAALGLDDNTIVVLWGDHGYMLGEMGMWTKHVNYELANRIPLIIAAPDMGSKGAHTTQLAETVDIYPTLADLAGLPAPEVTQSLDGLSMVSVLNNPEARIRDHAYHSFPRGGRLGRAIRTDRYRLVEWTKIDDPAEAAAYELYDYQNGPMEITNIADEQPEVRATLQSILGRHPAAMPPRPQSPRRE